MKRILMIMVLGALIAHLVPAQAQDFTQPRDPSIQSQQIMATGAAYSSTVYEPFNNTTPAEYNPVGGSSPSYAPGGPNKSIEYHGDQGGDPGSPLGDAVLPLLAFALMFCGVVYFRRKKIA